MAFPVTNGEKANQTTFNKVAGRLVDNTLSGKQDLVNTDAASGANVLNLQREVNSLNSHLGRVAGTAHDATPVWNNNDVGASTDTTIERADNLTAEFNSITGHKHSGAAGDGGEIDAANLGNINLLFAVLQKKTITVAGGTSNIVTTDFTGETSGGTDTTIGIATTAPRNRVEILDSNGGQIEDASGNDVYGRLTESVGVWTLAYYSSVAGVETAYNLSGQTIKIFYYEVFDQFDRPTFGAQAGEGLTANTTDDVVDATTTQRGLVNTGNQSWAGNKSTTGTLTASNLSGTNTGDVTLAAIGAVPNANGASLSGQVLTLQPADSSFGGLVSTIAQSYAGLKTFVDGVVANTILRIGGKVETSVANDNTSGSGVTLSLPTTEIIRLTNAALISITGITAPSGQAQKTIFINRTGVAITILNDLGTAANRILTGTNDDLTLEADAAVEIDYDTTTSKWQIVGGSGAGGGGALSVVATENISAAGTITAAVEQRELRRVQGNGAAVTANTTTPITAGTVEGQELILKGMSDTNTVTIQDSGNANLNGDMTLYAGSILSLVWVDSEWLEVARKI